MAESSAGDFYSELKRRNVFRTGAAYLVVAWLLVQVADLLLDVFTAPDWVMRALVIALAVGFPVALVLGWIFDITSHGVEKTRADVRQAALPASTARKIDFAIIGVLLVALLLSAAERFDWIDFSTPTQTDRRSIAVLPFANRSSLEEDLYFVDGIHDDLLTSLSKVHDLFVISRTSVMQYRDTTKSLSEIADELGVAVIVEGGVQRAGESVRINVQLIDGTTDEHIWAETYDRSLSAENIFAIQSEISETIVASLSAALTGNEKQRLERLPTRNLEALNALMLGDQRRELRTFAGREQAQEYYQRATELDAEYPDAWQRLAAVILTRWRNRTLPDEAMFAARDAIEKSIELDDQNGDAWLTRGEIEMEFMTAGIANYTIDEIEQMFLRAINLAPNRGANFARYAVFVSVANFDQQRIIELLEKAVHLDPLDPEMHNRLGDEYRKILRFKDALREFARARELRPDDPYAFWHTGETQRDAGNLADAIIWMERAIAIEPDDPAGPFHLALVATDLGADELALQWLEQGREIGPDHPLATYTRSLDFYLDNDTEAMQRLAEHELSSGADYLRSIPLYRQILMYRDIESGKPELALQRYETHTPGLFAEEPDFDQVHPNDVAHLAYLLQVLGRHERAEKLLTSFVAWLEESLLRDIRSSRTRLRLAEAQGLLGQFEQASAYLGRVAVDDWPNGWRTVREFRTFDVLRETEAFIALEARTDRNLERQRELLKAYRNGSAAPQ